MPTFDDKQTKAEITAAPAMSSHGIPVLRVQGQAYGTAEANFYLEKARPDELVDFKDGAMICSMSGRMGPK